MERVKGMGFDQVAAETTVQRAFGWGAKARSYWRHEKVCRTSHPTIATIAVCGCAAVGNRPAGAWLLVLTTCTACRFLLTCLPACLAAAA